MGTAAVRRIRQPSLQAVISGGGWLAFWAGAAWVAVTLTPVIVGAPVLALAPVALIVLAVVTAHAPPLALTAVLLMSGFYGTLRATFGLESHLVTHGLLAALWIAVLHRLVTRPGARPTAPAGVVALLALPAAALAWVALADHPFEAFGPWRETYWLMTVAPLVAIAPWPSLRSDRIAKVILVAGAAGAGYALLRWQIGASNAERELVLNSRPGFNTFGDKLRPLGGVADAHALSSLLAPLAVFSFALALTLRDRWRLVAVAVVAASAHVLVATDVRAGMVSAVAGIVVVLALLLAARGLGGGRLAAVYIGLVLVVGVVGAVVAFETGGLNEESQRFERILTPERDPAFQKRLFLWENALAEIDERPFGRGLGMALVTSQTRRFYAGDFNDDVVNSYLRVALEQGTMFALALVGAVLLVLFTLVRESITARDPGPSLLLVAAAGTLVTFAINLNFESTYIGIATAVTAWAIVGLGLRQVVWRGREP